MGESLHPDEEEEEWRRMSRLENGGIHKNKVSGGGDDEVDGDGIFGSKNLERDGIAEELGSDEEELSSINERYDWEKEKQRKLMFFDDGTMSFFW
jgi:hypothetical protein